MFSIEKLCFEVFVTCKHVLHAFFMEVSASLSFVIDEDLWVNKNIFRYKCFTVPFELQPACK